MISRIFVKTHEDNDGYIADHEYVFNDSKEASKFVSLYRESAVNAYGENVCLGYYEIVTNVTAEIDVEELREFGEKEKEENNLLLKLPCKVGDTVYVTRNYIWYKPVEIGVFPKKVTEIKMSFEEGRLKYFLSLEGQYFNFDKIGKEVFLTKEEAEKFVDMQEKRKPEKSLVGKRYLDKQRLPGTLKEVVDGPDSKWGQYVVKDLKTGKEHLCSGRYIMQNEVDEKSFEEWWDELDDIEKEEYNAIMSEDNEEIIDDEIEK